MSIRQSINALLLLGIIFLSACGSSGGGGGGGGGSSSTAAVFPRFAYVANTSAQTISIYTVDAGTGQLRNRGYVMSEGLPHSVVVDPSGRFAYAANPAGPSITAYSINASNGALTPVPGSPFMLSGTPGSRPKSIAIDPSSRFLYAADQDLGVFAFTIDAATGALRQWSSSPFSAGSNPNFITVDPSGRFVYVSNERGNSISAFVVNTGGEDMTPVPGSPIATGRMPQMVTIAPSGRFAYAATALDGIWSYSINSTTGALTPLDGSPLLGSTRFQSIVIDPSGRFIYGTHPDDRIVWPFTINTTTGAIVLDLAVPVVTTTQPFALGVDASGKFLYVTNFDGTVASYTINPANGHLTELGTAATQPGARSIALTQGSAPVSYAPRFAYVANTIGSGTSNISAYTVDAATGSLTTVAGSPFLSGTLTESVAVEPSGRFAYATNIVSGPVGGEVGIFGIDAATGALTPQGMSASVGPADPQSLAIEPSGRFLYVARDSGSVSGHRIRTDGSLESSFRASAGRFPRSIAVDPSGKFAYVANLNGGELGVGNVSAYTINTFTGALSAVPGSPFSTCPGCSFISVDPSGRFAYVVGAASVHAYRINSTTGALTAVPGSPFAAGRDASHSVAVDPTGRFVYVATSIPAPAPPFSGGSVFAYTLDPASGALTPIAGSPLPAGLQAWFVTVDPSGRFVYVTNKGGGDVSAYSINTATGALTPITGAPFMASGEPVSGFITPMIQ